MKDHPSPLKLAFECPKRWEDLRTAGLKRRFCDQCQLHVHDLSAMTRVEGAAFLSQADKGSCISFERSTDGSLVTRTRWSPLTNRWKQVRRGVLAMLAALAPFCFTACSAPDKNRTGGAPCMVGGGDGKDASKGTEASGHGSQTLGRVSVFHNPR